MSLFKEAARLAERWSCTDTPMNEIGAEMADLLRTIAALEGVSVEPVAKFMHRDLLIEHPLGTIPLYTQQQLEAAVLKARDAAIEQAAQSMDNNGEEGFAYNIRALKGKP